MIRRFAKLAASLALVISILPLAGCQEIKWGSAFKGTFQKEKTKEIKGEPWTILCLESYGENRHDAVEQFADALRNTRGIDRDQVRVAHTENASKILYGRYGREVDQRTGRLLIPEDMTADMRTIRQLSLPGREVIYPFAYAAPVPLDTTSTGPEEWDLLNTDAQYTLLVAVFTAVENRKDVAVELVRKLREEGDEAYYYHDATRSHVCVGAFKERDVMVLPDGKLRVLDPDYKRYKEKYPYYTLDGQYVSDVKRDAQNRKIDSVRQPTRLVEIPQ